MEEIKVHVSGETQTLTILTGEARQVVNPQPVQITGNIFAVRDYLDTRLERVKEKDSHVLISETKNCIQLIIDESSPLRHVITGRLEFFDQLTAFGINSNKTWTGTELSQFLKMNRIFFKDADQNAQVVSQLRNFKAKVNSELEKSSDTRGNAKNLFAKEVESEIIPEFSLEIPVFKGFPNSNFRVEVCFDVTDGGVKFWLESPELAHIIQAERDSFFDEQATAFKEKGLTVITE